MKGLQHYAKIQNASFAQAPYGLRPETRSAMEPGRQVLEEMFATPTMGSEKDPEADNTAGIENKTDARHVSHHVSPLDADTIGLVLRHRRRRTDDRYYRIIIFFARGTPVCALSTSQ